MRGSEPITAEVLAEAQRIPRSFLSKILAQCAKAGIIRSKRGPRGGVQLAKAAGQISLLAVIEACEGSYVREFCVFYSSRRCEGPSCEVYCPLREREEEIRGGLGRVTLADMAQSLNRHPHLKIGQVMEGFDGYCGQS